ALVRDIRRRRRPAGAQLGEEIADGVEIMVRPLVLLLILLGGDGLDRDLQVLAIGIVDLGNARSVIEHAAEARRAWPVGKYAAGLVRERDRIDLMAPPRIGMADRRNGEQQNTGNENDAPQHGTGSRNAYQ